MDLLWVVAVCGLSYPSRGCEMRIRLFYLYYNRFPMVTIDELLSRYQTEVRPGLLNPPLDLPGLLKNIDNYLLWRIDVEESGLEGEFPEVMSDAFDLIAAAFVKGVGILLNEIVAVDRDVQALEEKINEYTVWEGMAEEYDDMLPGLRKKLDATFTEGNRVIQNKLESMLLSVISEMRGDGESPEELNPLYLRFNDLENLVLDASELHLLDFLEAQLQPTIDEGHRVFEEVVQEALDEIVRRRMETGDVDRAVERIRGWELVNYYTEIGEMIREAIRRCLALTLSYDLVLRQRSEGRGRVQTRRFLKRMGMDLGLLGLFVRNPKPTHDVDVMHMHFQVKDLELGLTEYDAETGRYVLCGAEGLRYPTLVIPDDMRSAAHMGYSVEPPEMDLRFRLTVTPGVGGHEHTLEMEVDTPARNVVANWFVGSHDFLGIESNLLLPENLESKALGEVDEIEDASDGATFETLDGFIEESMDSMRDLKGLVDEISRARSLRYVFRDLEAGGGSPYAFKEYSQDFHDTAEVKFFGGTATGTGSTDRKTSLTIRID